MSLLGNINTIFINNKTPSKIFLNNLQVWASQSQTITTGNLVLNLDATDYNGSGNWIDTSEFQNNAAPVQSPTYFSSESGYFLFDGGSITTSGQVDSFSVVDTASLDNMAEISIEMWININLISGSTSPNMLFSKRSTTSNGYIGFFTSTGYVFRVGTGSPTQVSISSVPQTNQWQQIVITVNTSGSKVYKNGVEIQSTPSYTGSFNNINTNASLLIGDVNPNATGVFGFNGKLSIFRIYNKVLTPTEVNINYNLIKSRYGL